MPIKVVPETYVTFFLFPEVEGRVGSTLGPGDEEGALEVAEAGFYGAVYWVV